MLLGAHIDTKRIQTLLGLITPEEFTFTNATHTRTSSVRGRTPSLTVERMITAARRTQLSIDGPGASNSVEHRRTSSEGQSAEAEHRLKDNEGADII